MSSSPGRGRRIVLRSAGQEAGIEPTAPEHERSLLEATLEATTDAILVIDSTGSVVTYNRRFLDLWGIPESVVARRSDDELLSVALPHLKDPGRFLTRVRELYSAPEREATDILEFADGRIIERYTRPHYVDGRPAGRVWSFRDLSSLDAPRRGLAGRDFRSLFENNPVPTWVYRLDTLAILEVNAATVEKYGYAREELLAMHAPDLRAPDAEAGAGGLPPGITRHRTKHGHVFDVKIASHAIEFEEHIAAVVIAQDVSELVRIQHELTTSEDRVRKEAARARSLLAIADRLNAQLDTSTVLDAVCEGVTRALGVPAASVLLYDDQAHTFQSSASSGLPPEYSDRHRPIARALYEEHFARAGDVAFTVSDVRRASRIANRELYEACGIRSILCASMIREGALLGAVLAFSLGEPRTFSAEDLVLLKGLADHAAQALTNARYFGEFQQSTFQLAEAYDTTLEGWARALDLRDKETEGHCRRVSELAERLGHAMGQPPDQLVTIRRGALLHDIGKIAVPDRILLKKGELTDEEWTRMRQHPALAKELLERIPFLRNALDIPYAHHERWDGTGYPRGLRGTEIPLAARIFTVTDVWDSLRSNRPYRAAWEADRVRGHIQSLSGIHFDPIAVEAFLDLKLD